MISSAPSGYVVRFDIDDVVRGGADDLARALLDAWRRANGRVCDDLASYTDHLVILDGRPTQSDSPSVIFHGENSLLKRKLGVAVKSDSPQIRRSDFSADYRRICAQAYLDAALGKQPIFDLVRISNPLASGDDRLQTYHRLLLPVSTDQGVSFTLCYSLDAGPCRYPEVPWQSWKRHAAGTSPGINLNMPCFPAASPR